MSADPDFLPYLSAHEVLLQEVTGLGYSLTGVLGVPRIKGLEDRQAIYEAYNAVIEATLVDGASAAIAAIDRDLKTNDVILDDNARVVVTFYLKGEVVEPQEMPLAAFGRWFAAMTDAGIIDVRPVVPPSSLAAYGKGVTADYEAAVWDARGAALLLLPPRRAVLGAFTTRSPEGSRLRDAITAVSRLEDTHPDFERPPTDGATIAAGACYQVLHAEAIEPATVGDPVGWWWVAEAEPFVPIAQGLLPPPEGPSRSERMKSAITAGVSQEAYFLTRPEYAGSRERQSPLYADALPAGRAWSPAALRERKRRRVNLERKTYTLDEYLALSLDDLLILNLTEYGRVGWQHEISTGTTTKRFVTRYRGGSQQIRFADPTGDIAVGLLSATLSLPTAALRWTTAGMSFDRPFARGDEVRGVPTIMAWTRQLPAEWATTAGEVLMDRLLNVGLTERQAVVLLNDQAGWTAAEIAEVLKIARSTVAAHLGAARKILRGNLKTGLVKPLASHPLKRGRGNTALKGAL